MKKLLTLALFAQSIAPAFSGPAPDLESVSNLDSSSKAVESSGLDPAWTAPSFGSGFKSNGNYNSGHLFFLYPWNNTIGEGGTMDGSMFFFEPYGIWGDQGSLEGSLALGYRRLFSQQSVEEAMTDTNPGFFGEGIHVGGNISVDYGQSQYDNYHGQVRLGLELGSRYIELRGNYHLPFTDESVVADFGFLKVYEEVLEGWDVELAVLVPGIDRYMDVQLIGGYHSYKEDQIIGSGYDGWQAGVEVRPVPNLVLGANWFEKQQHYKDNWLASIRIEIPWGATASMFKSAFKPRRRHLAERMFKPIRRKNSLYSTAVTVLLELFSGESESENLAIFDLAILLEDEGLSVDDALDGADWILSQLALFEGMDGADPGDVNFINEGTIEELIEDYIELYTDL